MSALRDRFSFADFRGDPAASDVGHRAQRITESLLHKLSKFRLQSPTIEEWLLGTKAARLADIPFQEFDAIRDELTKHLKRHGCCEVSIGIEKFTLTHLAQHMESAAEQLAPYRALLPKSS